MKKILSILLVLIMCLGVFASCGEPETEPVDFTAAKTAIFNLYNNKLNSTKDYDVVAKVDTFSVTWTSSDSSITIKESTKENFWTVDLPDSNETEKTYTLTATISNGEQSVTVDFAATLPKYSALQGDTSSAIETGKAYTIGYKHDGENKQYYITGYPSGYYLATTETITDAVNFYFEETTGGYNLYYILAGTKYYLNMIVSGNFVNPSSYDTTPTTVYNYDEDLGSIYAMVGNDAYTIGVRTDTNDDGKYYTTVGPVLVSQASEKYIIALFDSANADQEGLGLTTPQQIVDAAYALAQDAQLQGVYTLTGVITSIGEAYSSQYGNITLDMSVNDTNKSIKVYRMKGEGADQIAVGDTITVVGVIKNYKGTVEFDSGCILKSYTKGQGGTGGGTTAGDASISFADVANRVSADANAQVWEQNGITFTNSKGASTSDIDPKYTNPVRCYKSSDITIEYAGMTKIVVNCNTADYATALVNSITGATASANGKVVTIILSAAADSFTVSALSAQVRIDSIDVYTGEVSGDEIGGGDDTGTQPENPYTAATELKNGDVVIIVADAYKMALSTEKVATYYNKGVDYSNGFDAITDAELFVVTVNGDGTYTFTSKTGKVIALAEEKASLNDTGANTTWTLEAKTGADGVFYVKNEGRGNYLEWYASKNNWSSYSPSNLDAQFEISFFVVNDEAPDAGGDDTTGGDDDTGTQPENPYTAATELKNGDVVIIVADAYKMALSADKVSSTSYYNKGVDYTNGFDAITDAELFVVTVNGDGTYTFTSKTGKVIALADSYASLNDTGAHNKWTLEETSTEGAYYVYNEGRDTYLEWYASMNNWSTYSTSNLDAQFEISFFVVEAAQ